MSDATTRHEAPDWLPDLPDDCRVRLIDLDPGVGGLIAVSEDGFVNIYLNARLSRDGQLRALRHELRHWERGDLYSDADIREVERLADVPMVLAIDGTPLERPAPAFDPKRLRAVGRGLYAPVGENLARAEGDVKRLRALLLEACHIYDVMRGAPAPQMTALAEGLCIGDLAFIAWQPPGSALPVALRFCREDGGMLHGAIYYDARGRLHDAVAAFDLDDCRVAVDLRPRAGKLDVGGIVREAGDITERIY